MKEIRAVAPTRVDFAGGTLDLWPIHRVLDSPSATVNVGVNLHAETRVRMASAGVFSFEAVDQEEKVAGSWHDVIGHQPTRLIGRFVEALWRPEWGGLEVQTIAKSPAGAGLGGSSALAITLVGALNRLRYSLGHHSGFEEEQIVNICSNVESGIIEIPTGVQDYWGALRGGVNILTYPPEGVSVKTYPTTETVFLAERLLLCYSGKSRASARNNWDIFKAVFDKDRHVLNHLNQIAEAAAMCSQAVIHQDWDTFVEASQQEWMCREQLWPDIHTAETRRLAQAASNAGAIFSRVCGAGGGGVMAILVEPDRRHAVTQALEEAQGQILNAGIADRGLHIWDYVGE